MPVSTSPQSTRLAVYLAWVHEWLHPSSSNDPQKVLPALEIDTISTLFQDANLDRLLDPTLLNHVITSFQQRFQAGEIPLSGTRPPSCAETNLLSEQYDPRVDCACDGISPLSLIQDADMTKAQACQSIARMLAAQQDVSVRCDEWDGHGLFTVEKLHAAVEEITFCNLEMEERLTICSGASVASLPPIQAPDRRPSPRCDSAPHMYHAWFPTLEEVKLCADAKNFLVIACGGSLVDAGILRAIADAANDILIGDYYEAATEETLRLLQKSGAAAVAFVKACNLAGVVSDWQLDIVVASVIQFRVVAYYRNHAVSTLPKGLYGSRMTGLTMHRHIDLGHGVGVVAASLATGQQIDETEYMELSVGTMLINDLVDLRSDAMRKQRENPVLRGMRGSICRYLNQRILDCIISVRKLIESKQLLAMVTMSFCNWTVMSSHHKLYELTHGVCKNTDLERCKYDGLDEQYNRLLDALSPYGSLGPDRPHWGMKRMELDAMYNIHRQSPETHLAWLADMVRLFLDPSTFRSIVDVVHYSWQGDLGQVQYCP
ncbi:hypothetical protein BDV28DRAFT_156282 [Aspergillus coremiiformis]|uniref:Uncharacterized protein n=1 Tax=Aspergillus coremiiformis TaxID=138285 RepID=A0A5N6ZAZ8_9EURO|nr:hypothetical protein BDV28DRAFT_156282 [Aspergillus coremiiformis]